MSHFDTDWEIALGEYLVDYFEAVDEAVDFGAENWADPGHDERAGSEDDGQGSVQDIDWFGEGGEE